MRVEIHNPSGRRTECRVVNLGSVRLYFSYHTLIGAAGDIDGDYKTLRRSNDWGPTTGRHINELGIRHYPEISEDELLSSVRTMLGQMTVEHVARALEGTN